MDDPFKGLRGLGDLLRDPLADWLREQAQQRELLSRLGRNSMLEAAQAASLLSSRAAEIHAEVGSFTRAAEAALGRASLAQEAMVSLRPEYEIARALEAARLATDAVAQAREIFEKESGIIGARVAKAANWSATLRGGIGGFHPFAPLVEQLSSELRRLPETGKIRAGFAGNLVAALTGVASATEDQEVVTAFQAAAEWYSSEAGGRSRDPIGYLTFFSIFLMLLIFVIQKYYSIQSEARILSRVSEAEERLLGALHQLAPRESASTVVLARRSLKLHTRPSAKSSSLRTILPNTPLEVLSVQGDWLRVKVFDTASEHAIVGWVYKRFVARVRFDLGEPAV